MAHDVFISHSSKDKQIADAMCHKLESNGIRCWMAPRDIWPGKKWSEAIVQAVGESSLMLLIFSTNANASDHIERELEIASRKRVPLLPFRVEDVEPSEALEYYLRTPHWLDALTPPLEQHLNQLVKSVKRHLPLERHEIPAQQTPHAAPAAVTPAPAADDFPRTMRNQVGIELVHVPAGSFMMGSESLDSEKPVHQVTIREGFYIGKYPVTQAQWQQVMGIGSNPSHFKGENLPVEEVSWNNTQEFIRRLNATNDGFIYRLPSEAEWEYACRAGTSGDYAGDLDSMAWYENNSGQQTHPVGQKLPNAFGLYDMHGNVSEWCEDYHHENYDGAPTDGSAWLSGAVRKKWWHDRIPDDIATHRALRGGSWVNAAHPCRSAFRNWWLPRFPHSSWGFRIVASARS